MARRKPPPRSPSTEAIFSALEPAVEAIAATFGRACEVVLHDYRDQEHSVVAVGGAVTGRRVGDAMSEIGLRVLAAGERAENEVNYVTRTDDGRVLKCTTIPLRDGANLIGALCINVDVSAIWRAVGVLGEMVAAPDLEPAPALGETTFSGTLDELVDRIVTRAERAHALPASALGRDARLKLVRTLHESGVFALRGGATRVAKRLGVSRAGLYNDLAVIRPNEDGRR